MKAVGCENILSTSVHLLSNYGLAVTWLGSYWWIVAWHWANYHEKGWHMFPLIECKFVSYAFEQIKKFQALKYFVILWYIVCSHDWG